MNVLQLCVIRRLIEIDYDKIKLSSSIDPYIPIANELLKDIKETIESQPRYMPSAYVQDQETVVDMEQDATGAFVKLTDIQKLFKDT